MIIFFKFSTNFIRHISTSMTSWRKIFCMRITHTQYASHKKVGPMRVVTCGDWVKKPRKGAENDDHSVITPPPMNQS